MRRVRASSLVLRAVDIDSIDRRINSGDFFCVTRLWVGCGQQVAGEVAD